MTWRSIFEFGRREPVALVDDETNETTWWDDLKSSESQIATGALCYEVRPSESFIVRSLKRDTYLLDDLYMCSWCRGTTRNDDYGHCLACGGPRG